MTVSAARFQAPCINSLTYLLCRCYKHKSQNVWVISRSCEWSTEGQFSQCSVWDRRPAAPNDWCAPSSEGPPRTPDRFPSHCDAVTSRTLASETCSASHHHHHHFIPSVMYTTGHWWWDCKHDVWPALRELHWLRGVARILHWGGAQKLSAEGARIEALAPRWLGIGEVSQRIFGIFEVHRTLLVERTVPTKLFFSLKKSTQSTIGGRGEDAPSEYAPALAASCVWCDVKFYSISSHMSQQWRCLSPFRYPDTILHYWYIRAPPQLSWNSWYS